MIVFFNKKQNNPATPKIMNYTGEKEVVAEAGEGVRREGK